VRYVCSLVLRVVRLFWLTFWQNSQNSVAVLPGSTNAYAVTLRHYGCSPPTGSACGKPSYLVGVWLGSHAVCLLQTWVRL
jgi:hypothetical protein